MQTYRTPQAQSATPDAAVLAGDPEFVQMWGNGAIQEMMRGGAGMPGLGSALEACFGPGVGNIHLDPGTSADADAAGGSAMTVGNHVNLGGMDVSHEDPHSLEVLGHEVAHAMAGGGSGEELYSHRADPAEHHAEAAGRKFSEWVGSGMQGPAPRISPAHGGRAAIHRADGDEDTGPSRNDMLDALDEYSTVHHSVGEMRAADAEVMDHDRKAAEWQSQYGASPTQQAACELDSRYTGKAPENRDPTAQVDLDTADGRLDALSHMTQRVNDKDKREPGMCAPTSVLGGMMYAKGPQGVQDVIDAMKAGDPSIKDDYADIENKIASGEPLEEGDLNFVKHGLAHHFNQTMEGDSPDCANQIGTSPATTSKFINDNPEIQKAFAEHHMSINGLDVLNRSERTMERDGSIDHAVLMVHDDAGKPVMVYDPETRNGRTTDRDGMGSQIVQDPAQLEDYRLATVRSEKALEEGEVAPPEPTGKRECVPFPPE